MVHADSSDAAGATSSSKLPPKGRFRKRVLLLGGLTVGTVELLDVLLFYGARGSEPIRVIQAIASGLIGIRAFLGGWVTALFGLGLHYLIAGVVVTVFAVASTRWPDLRRRPLVWGPLYGAGVYLVMNFVVVPLSYAIPGHKTLAVVANGLLTHMLGVGLPSALFARAAFRDVPRPADWTGPAPVP
jgi:hypothetical protein